GQEEAGRAVVQQRRVVRAQRRGHRRVSLVTGGADRVEALVEAAQPPGGEVEVAAGELGVEELEGTVAGGPGTVTDRLRRRPPAPRRGQKPHHVPLAL